MYCLVKANDLRQQASQRQFDDKIGKNEGALLVE